MEKLESKVTVRRSDLELFSKASGDFNAIHLDAVFASRTQFRKPVVYAIQTLVVAINELCDRSVFLKNLQVRFLAPVLTGRQLDIIAYRNNSDFEMSVLSRNKSLVSAKFNIVSKEPIIPVVQFVCDFASQASPSKSLLDVRVGQSTTETICFAEESGRFLFPEKKGLHDYQVSILLCCSRALATTLLGKYWILVAIDIDFSRIVSELELTFVIARVSSGTEMVVIDVMSKDGNKVGTIYARVLKRGSEMDVESKDRITLTKRDSMKGKTVLVTGASRGVGQAISRVFASRQANLICHCATNITLLENLKEELEKEYGIKVATMCSDLSMELTPQKLITDAVSVAGQIDYLVHSAFPGVSQVKFREIDRHDIHEQITFSTYQMFDFIHELVNLNQVCTVVGMSSIAVKEDMKEMLPYIIGKVSLETMFRYSELELLKNRIRLKIIRPGETNTDLHIGVQDSRRSTYIEPIDLAKKIVDFLESGSQDLVLEVSRELKQT